MRVSAHIVTYQSLAEIGEALASLGKQTFEDFRVVVVDNASSDETVEFITREYGNRIALLRNYQNLGFAVGHNQAIQFALRTRPEFMLLMNPDVVLEYTTLAELVAAMERHPRAGVIGGRLLRPDRSTIDSTGIRARRSFWCFERGSGKPESGNYLREEEVFGISGALALYRTDALEDIASAHEYFDSAFFAYKEDVDVSWRLRLRGWEAWYTHRAIATHRRAARGNEQQSVRAVLAFRKLRSRAISKWSYRNHWWVIAKNLQPGLLARNFPWFFIREFATFIYLLCMEPATLAVLPETVRAVPRLRRQRQAIMARARIKSRDIQRWFT